LKARSGYKLDARVAKAAKIIERLCPNYCPCCKSKSQTIEHWLVEYPYFNDLRDEFSSILTVIMNQFSTRTTTASSTNIETSNLNNSDNILNRNFIDNNNLVNNIVYNNSSVCKEVFKFLLGGRTLNENHNTRKWMEFYNCQTKPGDFSETLFLVATAAILNKIMPIALSQQWVLFGRFFLKTAKSVNAEKTVGQVSRTSATVEDHNFVT